ncbi:hypothetical protein CDV50_17005 [Haematobacter massiliensis]|uniref:DUF2382 domain-containing protein n=1 Tax=Haematobacter genomosp. 1 TaxID=366618 RepID=A0A212A6K0_9RHOB|nr:hypothetical protein CDV50_17005 [Haematobacter massiliensis]OWJ74437.1 hypothetical protein CDV49_19520 [Haematobacter genomosp. 1]OWJ83089.1 hypothetical protein CDV51_16905 [Haematobacter massiliensis]QBJ23072.1 DUF2382 domain-containing protein [Haematobacter massiliensis]
MGRNVPFRSRNVPCVHPLSMLNRDGAMTEDGKDVLPLVEERVSVTAEARVSGRVRVSTHTEAVDTLIPVDLAEVDVEVTRIPVDRAVDHAPDITTDGDTTIIPVMEERLVVTRQLFVREEIHIRRMTHRETVDVPVTTRRQTATIERLPPHDEQDIPPFPSDKDI